MIFLRSIRKRCFLAKMSVKKGGVYGVSQHLVHAFGANRVINTLLDEQSILGLAIGLAQQGFLPVARNSVSGLCA
ncbi:hypothetical protein [Alishewanella longhuensis]